MLDVLNIYLFIYNTEIKEPTFKLDSTSIKSEVMLYVTLKIEKKTHLMYNVCPRDNELCI